MIDPEALVLAVRSHGPGLVVTRVGDKLQWLHPEGPFEYVVGRDAVTGAWGWAMRNVLVDPEDVFTSSGDFGGLPDLPSEVQLADVIVRFLEAELKDLEGPDGSY